MDSLPSHNYLPSCPACDRPAARRLAEASTISSVNYYICDFCDRVWTTDKDTGAIVKQIALSRHTQRASN